MTQQVQRDSLSPDTLPDTPVMPPYYTNPSALSSHASRRFSCLPIAPGFPLYHRFVASSFPPVAVPLANRTTGMYNRTMIRNVVFDMGNVLVRYDAEYIASQFTQDEAARKLLLTEIFRAPEWTLLDAGLLDEEEMRARIAKRLPDALVETGLRAYAQWHCFNRRIPEAESLVDELKRAGCRLYLLSNAAARWRVYWRDFPAMTALDGHIVSALVGALKPDAAIYRILFDTYGLDPAESYFVDDVAANVEAGRALGMDGFVLDRFQYGALREALKEKGVPLETPR